ncbi:putative methylthioribulose-1-phosphate dehydratase, HAD superfamily [Helianthus anomalus]
MLVSWLFLFIIMLYPICILLTSTIFSESSCSTTTAKFSCTNEGQRNDSLNPNHSSRHLKQTENIGLSGAKVYIYLSGSRLAQRFIYGYINYGNLRKYLCGFFDTRVGRNKRETQSYNET